MEIVVPAFALGITIAFLRDLNKAEPKPDSPEDRLGKALSEILKKHGGDRR